MPNIFYKEGYKYQLEKPYQIEVFLSPSLSGGNDFVYLHPSGWLEIKRGYAWDGPSGPALDTLDFMRGSLVHDALYQLIRMGVLTTKYESHADDLLRELCIEDGMNPIRAWWVYKAVTMFGKYYLSSPENPVKKAP